LWHVSIELTLALVDFTDDDVSQLGWSAVLPMKPTVN